MKRPQLCVGFLLFSLCSMHTGAAFAAHPLAMCGNAIDGDSTNPLTLNCADLLAWNWGGSRPISGTGPSGQVSFGAVNVTKAIDGSSVDLLTNLSAGSILSGPVEIRAYANCGCPSGVYLQHKLQMENVRVSSVSVSASTGSDPMIETIALQFSKFTYCTYEPSGTDKCLTYDIAGGTITN